MTVDGPPAGDKSAEDDRRADDERPVLLVAYDGGPMSEAQVHLACRAANDIDAVVRVVRVIELPPHVPIDARLAPDQQAEMEASFARVEAIAQRFGARCDIVVATARSVSEVILAEARESGASAIFVGLREHRRPGATLMLSRTLRHILRRAPCPVQIAYVPGSGMPPE